MELTAGVRVSAHVPAPATNRQDAVIRRGMSTTATAPVWEGVTIIPDEVTKAKAGQIVITAVMLFAMKVLRTGAGPFPLIWDWDRKPPASLVELVSVASQEVYAACGFQHGPMGRLSGGLSPGSMAAGLIRCAITVGAAGGKASCKTSSEDTVTLSWQELRASDLSGRARAFQSMVGGGMAVAEAVS